MKEKLQSIKEEALKAIEQADLPEKLNDVRVKYLGKKGELTAVLKGMKDVAPEDRPKVGQMVNETREAIEKVMEERKVKMERAIREEQMKKEVIDVTLPSKKNMVGHRHPNTCLLYTSLLVQSVELQSRHQHSQLVSDRHSLNCILQNMQKSL